MENKVTLKGFPTEVGEFIELPDIAELLTYPIFFDADLETVYKYGSDFQRKLIDMTPLRHTKKTISVMSEVILLTPNTRTCTGGFIGDEDREWHIDCEENEDGRHVYHEGRDIVHLFTNEVTSMTEFNKNETIIDWDPNLPYHVFSEHLYQNRQSLGLEAQKMPHNRIVTFTNHLHRATNPQRAEFKFMFRIVETDRQRPANTEVKTHSTIVNPMTGSNDVSVEQTDDRIIIHIPEFVEADERYKLNLEALREKNTIDEDVVFKKLGVDGFAWEGDILPPHSELRNFLNQDSIMVIVAKNFDDPKLNDALDYFFRNMDRTAKLIDTQGNEMHARIVKDFYDGGNPRFPLAGVLIQLTNEQAANIKDNEDYTVQFNTNAEFSFVVSDSVKFNKSKLPF